MLREERFIASGPGISGNELYEGRDLAITTDFRQVISTVLETQFGLTSTQLSKVIPNPPRANQELRGLIRV